MEVGHNHFLRHQGQVVESLVAQAALLAGHLLVILLEGFEILELTGFFHIDKIGAEDILISSGSHMTLVICQIQRFGSPSGSGCERIIVASPARIVMKKLGNSTHP